jgi:hypothetical protein
MNHFSLALPLTLGLCVAATAAPPKDPQVDLQLKALFNKWDLDHDGFLDKEELAKHFRGPKAKPPQGDMYDDKGNLTPLFYQARTKYPDLVFLWSLDKDMDGRINWTEFEQYGQAYAAALKQLVKNRQQLALTQQRALQNMYAQAYRNVRHAQHRHTSYNRHAHRSYGRRQRHVGSYYARNVSNYQRQVANAQAQAMRQYRYAVERQQNFVRMAMAQRRRWLQQYQSYMRQRMAFVHRMVLRHSAARFRGRFR